MRGHHYGTVRVDLESREPIAVFAGREAASLTTWLREHLSIQIVARDRVGVHSEAVQTTLSTVTRVSDRWHMLCNLRENVERMLHRLGRQLRHAAQHVVLHGVTLGRYEASRGASLRGWHA